MMTWVSGVCRCRFASGFVFVLVGWLVGVGVCGCLYVCVCVLGVQVCAFGFFFGVVGVPVDCQSA